MLQQFIKIEERIKSWDGVMIKTGKFTEFCISDFLNVDYPNVERMYLKISNF